MKSTFLVAFIATLAFAEVSAGSSFHWSALPPSTTSRDHVQFCYPPDQWFLPASMPQVQSAFWKTVTSESDLKSTAYPLKRVTLERSSKNCWVVGFVAPTDRGTLLLNFSRHHLRLLGGKTLESPVFQMRSKKIAPLITSLPEDAAIESKPAVRSSGYQSQNPFSVADTMLDDLYRLRRGELDEKDWIGGSSGDKKIPSSILPIDVEDSYEPVKKSWSPKDRRPDTDSAKVSRNGDLPDDEYDQSEETFFTPKGQKYLDTDSESGGEYFDANSEFDDEMVNEKRSRLERMCSKTATKGSHAWRKCALLFSQ